jgi:hypothetical protein
MNRARGLPPWLSLLVTVLALLAAPAKVAWAGPPTIQLQTDGDTIGVGDVVHVIMTVQGGDSDPGNPQIRIPAGLMSRGQSSSQQVNINGNHVERRFSFDFALQAKKTGTFKVVPSVDVGGTRFSTTPLAIHVVAAGKAPPRMTPQAPQSPFAPFGFSPFDPWKGLLQAPPDQDLQPTPAVNTDPRLSLDAPRGELYFLHATVDKPSAVVGEQVVFSVFEYLDASAGGVEVDESDVHDATAADFVKHPLLREDQEAQITGFAQVGGRNWQVKLVRRWALFPLRAGDLTIGPMNVSVVRPRGVAGKRTTELLTIHVAEPPAAGRPPGYALGDVGKFALTAQVTPRDIEQGGAVGVHVELSGSGNVPGALATPAREGVEWLAPETHDQLGATGQQAFGGKRSFDYVVRVLRAGEIDLGELALPYWDPDARRYQVTRAPLGVLHVKPTASGAAASSASHEQEKLQGLPGPRDTLEGERPGRTHLDDSRVFWLGGIGAWPVALGLFAAGSAVTRRVRTAWTSRKESPAADLRERVAAANAACEGTDGRAADAAIERALQSATVAHAGVNIRGALGAEVAERLVAAGIKKDVADRVAELLRECEDARFSPDATDVAGPRQRWVRARGAIRSLESRA